MVIWYFSSSLSVLYWPRFNLISKGLVLCAWLCREWVNRSAKKLSFAHCWQLTCSRSGGEQFATVLWHGSQAVGDRHRNDNTSTTSPVARPAALSCQLSDGDAGWTGPPPRGAHSAAPTPSSLRSSLLARSWGIGTLAAIHQPLVLYAKQRRGVLEVFAFLVELFNLLCQRRECLQHARQTVQTLDTWRQVTHGHCLNRVCRWHNALAHCRITSWCCWRFSWN